MNEQRIFITLDELPPGLDERENMQIEPIPKGSGTEVFFTHFCVLQRHRPARRVRSMKNPAVQELREIIARFAAVTGKQGNPNALLPRLESIVEASQGVDDLRIGDIFIVLRKQEETTNWDAYRVASASTTLVA